MLALVYVETTRPKRDEALLEKLKEQSRKLDKQKKNGFIAYTWDVAEAMRRINELEQRVQSLEAQLEHHFPDPEGEEDPE